MAPTDFLALTAPHRADLDGIALWLKPRLAAAGWRCAVDHPLLRLYVSSGTRLEVTSAFDGHGALIGEMFDRESFRRLDSTERQGLACRPLDPASAAALVERAWGRYVLIRRTSTGAAVLRDPSGAVECVGWVRGPLRIFASTAQAPVDLLFPDAACIDPGQLQRIAASPGEFNHGLGLTHLHPVPAGGLLLLGGEAVTVEQIWKPGEIYRQRGAMPSDSYIREEVVQTVRALAGDRHLIAELSGGLDSAIVAACLSPAQRKGVAEWVNHRTPEFEGDERVYARAVAARLGLRLTEVLRDRLPVSEMELARTAAAFRPAVNDLDPGYNADIGARIQRTGVDAVLTGQGGDGVFFQMASAMIGLDEIAERGWRTRASVLFRIARWTRQSAWPGLWLSAYARHRRDRKGWDHPWVKDLAGTPPAKQFQVNALAYCQVFQQAARRSRVGDCLNPLLAQPVMEMGLSLSTVDLTWGGRDRALIRRAFADDLPSLLLERRSKGDVGAFYGQAMVEHLGFFRDYLLGGALVEDGHIDRKAIEPLLSADQLLWRGGHGAILSLALVEAWLRHWRSRLASRSRPPADIDQTSPGPGRASG